MSPPMPIPAPGRPLAPILAHSLRLLMGRSLMGHCLRMGLCLLMGIAPAFASPPPEAPATPPAPASPPPAHVAAPAPTVERRWIRTREPGQRVESAEERSLEQLGRLVFSRVDLEADGVPLREVLKALRKSLGINLVVYERDPTGRSKRDGIDADVPVSISLSDVEGRAALATLLGFAGNDVTWQLRDGIVEVGPKEVLARPDARRTALYDVTDISLDPPDFDVTNPYAPRKTLDHTAGEILRMIAAQCEPRAFDPVEPAADGETTPAGGGRAGPARHASPGGRVRSGPNTTATRNFDPSLGPIFIEGRWASVQLKQKHLVVHAPDFVHRAIDGYPAAIPPPAPAE